MIDDNTTSRPNCNLFDHVDCRSHQMLSTVTNEPMTPESTSSMSSDSSLSDFQVLAIQLDTKLDCLSRRIEAKLDSIYQLVSASITLQQVQRNQDGNFY